ncbi:MAG: hypothetical protein AB7O24_01135 [Kofleriaceae bacterium]
MNLRDALRIGEVLVDGLELLEHQVDIGGEAADKTLAVIKTTLTTLRECIEGKVSPVIAQSQISAQMHEMHEQQRAARASVDRDLANKFDLP